VTPHCRPDPNDPLAWVCERGVVLQSARGPLPNLAERLAAVDERHTATGAHRTVEVAFPDWVPAAELSAATLLRVDEALAQLPACLRFP
jgi:hypothetical protein